MISEWTRQDAGIKVQRGGQCVGGKRWFSGGRREGESYRNEGWGKEKLK